MNHTEVPSIEDKSGSFTLNTSKHLFVHVKYRMAKNSLGNEIFYILNDFRCLSQMAIACPCQDHES